MKSLSLTLCVITMLCGPEVARAQSAPPPNPPAGAPAGRTVSPAAAPQAGTAATQPDSINKKDDEVITLSPFEVSAQGNSGYFAANTTSGTRINSKIEDLGAAISVVTKQQMEDWGLLDVNDLFNYETSTEGTGNFTDFSFNSSGMPIDNVQANPQGANRIRGLNSANVNYGSFETSGRTPIDPSNIDGVEISRGPNSNIFGIGSPAGTVNSVPASASVQRNTATVSGRVDDRDGWRASIDINRVLKSNVFGVRFSAVSQYDGYALKPSGVDTTRYNVMAKVRPLKTTTLSGSYMYYHAKGNRPNSLAPRDGISGWMSSGSPTWDPIAGTVKINGQIVGTYPGTTNPPGFTTQIGTILGYIDGNGLSYLGQARGSSGNSPRTQDQPRRLLLPVADPSGYLASQTLFQKYPVLSNKNIYDWSAINLAAMNTFEDETKTVSVLLDQSILKSRLHQLDAQLGYFYENGDRYTSNLLGSLSPSAGFSSSVTVDVNERLLDGKPNPYFLRPFVQLDRPYVYRQPTERDTYRAQAAYQIDLREKENWLKWLGLHRLTAYTEYKEITSRQYVYRNAITSNHPWTDATSNRGNTASYIIYPRFYVGDGVGGNVDYAPAPLRSGRYNLHWGNAVTGVFNDELIDVAEAISSDSSATGGINNSLTENKTLGGILQSFWLKDHVITTFGLREDKNYNRLGRTPVVYPDPITIDEPSFRAWSSDPWTEAQGQTWTAGVVVRPFRWLSLSANKSNSFTPAAVGFDLYNQVLPNPTGEGEDYGFTLNLLDNRLFVRVNYYETTQVNSRNGDSSNIAQRVRRLDYIGATGSAYNLQRQATAWITEAAEAAGQTLTTDELNRRLSNVMKIPVSLLTNPPNRPYAVDDLLAKGTEIEVNYNPNQYWTLRGNVAEQETINAQLASTVTQWIEERLPVWPTIIDPRYNQPWWSYNYGGGTAQEYYTSNVLNPLQIARALEGKSRPQVRRYRANFMTSYRLAGLTDEKILKRFTIGGAVRWEDRGSIGYYGTGYTPANPTAIITTLDANRPVWDESHTYLDAFVTYKTKLFSDKVGMTLQLNVRNVMEEGRLQPVAAEGDGRISAYRIVDPRQFILTATFSL